VAAGCGFRDGYLQLTDLGLRGRDPRFRYIGFLAPLLAQSFGLGDSVFQRSDFGFQHPNRAAFGGVGATAQGTANLLGFQIGQDASLQGLCEIWIGQSDIPLRVTATTVQSAWFGLTACSARPT